MPDRIINDRATLVILLLIGAFSVTVRLLQDYNLDRSGLLYVGLPFIVALVITAFTRTAQGGRWYYVWWNMTRWGLIVMLGSSIVLFEGFLCVALFLPLYLLFVLVGFGIAFLYVLVKRRGKGVFSLHLLPLLVLTMALEGTHPALSFDRENSVSRSRIVEFDIPTIKARLAYPMTLPQGQGWFTGFFPMPYDINAGSLAEGDVHEVRFRYNRWLVTNTHEGVMLLQIQAIGPAHIRTRILKDTSYLSKYMTFHGTLVAFEPILGGQTRVTVTASFRRELDPAWYFAPLQRYAVAEALEHLLEEIIDGDV